MRLVIAALIGFCNPFVQAAEPSFDALSHLLHAYAGPIDENATEAAPEAGVPPESGARLAKIQSDLSLLAEGFEAFRHPSHAQRALGDLPDHISPELRPFFKNRASTLDAVYRTLAVTDYTWALRFPEPDCDPRSRRKSLLASRDGLFTDLKSGGLSPWLSRLLGPSAGGRTSEEALDRASGRQVLSARDYELVRVKVAKITEALTSEKAVGAERARLYCLRAEAYETMSAAHQAAQEGPIQAARGTAAEDAPDKEASSVLLLAFVEGPNRFRAVGAGVMVETARGPRVLSDARLMPAAGEDKPTLYGFARAKDGTLDKPRVFVIERKDASGVMAGRLEDGEGIPALKIAQGPAARRDFYRAIGHMGASGAWTVSQGLVTESGDGTFSSDAILGPDMLGSPLLNDAGEVVGLVVLSPGAGAPAAVHVEHLRRVADGDLPASKDLEFLAARQTGSGSLLTTATPFVGELSIPGSGAIEARSVTWSGGGGVGVDDEHEFKDEWGAFPKQALRHLRLPRRLHRHQGARHVRQAWVNDSHGQEVEMRIFDVYLRLSGTDFNIEAFQARLPSAHKGAVKPVYRMVGAEKTVAGRFWRSKAEAVREPDVSTEASRQLRAHGAALGEARAFGAEKIYLVLAMSPKGTVSRERVALSHAVKRRLAGLGAEVDMNIPQATRL